MWKGVKRLALGEREKRCGGEGGSVRVGKECEGMKRLALGERRGVVV